MRLGSGRWPVPSTKPKSLLTSRSQIEECGDTRRLGTNGSQTILKGRAKLATILYVRFRPYLIRPTVAVL